MDVSKIPPGRDPPLEINVLIEIPQGGVPVKYELDKISGALFVNRFLHTAMYYPANYGFIPSTSLKMAIRVMRWRSRRSQSPLAR
jgi:inorganic pyrophosphatase